MRLGIALITLLIGIAANIGAQAKLEIPGNRFNFGMAPQNSTVANYFWFKSVGSDTLKIKQIKTGCSCTTMPLERDWIAPGDSMIVGVYWETENRVGSTGKYPYIFIDGQEEAMRLFLTADISLAPDSSRPLSIKPFKAELSKIGAKSIDSVSILFTNHQSSPIILKTVSVLREQYSVVLPDTIPPNGIARGYIRLNPAYVDKSFTESVTIEYGVSEIENKRFTIPIRRKIY